MKIKFTYPFAIILVIGICISNHHAFAKEVAINTAKNVAINLYNERAGNMAPNISISRIIEEKEKGETIFYVMIYSEKGFALVSADDIVQPILGYSFESTYDENNLSPAFEFYILERFRKQIYAARQAKVIPDEKTIKEWNKLSTDPIFFQPKGVKSAFPLLTTVWDQDSLFNTQCPADPGGPDGHALVGCVATAMAQVLNYWQHPWHGTGSHSYTPDDHPEYGVQSANFANAIYNFDNMPDTVTDYSDDLAELMYHCAVSVDMNFGPTGSGAWGWSNNDVSDALKSYFYFNDAADCINRSSYPATWVDKMKENLDANRPVIYGARDNQEDAGHAWVLDAYQEGDMFHCNWGWSGSCDGFYSIDDFSPSGSGFTFDVYEHACVKIYPEAGHVSGTWNLAGSPYYLDYDHYVDPGEQLIIEPGVELIFTGRYKLEVQGKLDATGTVTDSIIFTSELPEIGMRGIRFSNLNYYVVDSSKVVYCRLEKGKGEYTVVNAYSGIKGGAVYCENSSKVLIANSTIKNSSAGYGGGIACYDTSNIRIRNCVITNDSAVMGGGIYLSYSNAVLSNNLIYGNKCSSSTGGGVYCSHSDATFYKDIIRNNISHFGGGMGFGYSNAVLDSVVIHDNFAESDGGGIYTFESDLNLNHVQLYFNSTDSSGGAILCGTNSDLLLNHTLIHNNYATEGAAMAVYSAHPALLNVTMSDNTAYQDGEAILIENGNITIENSILWNNCPEEIDTSGNCSVTASYSIIQNGNWPGDGVINYNPLLFNAPATWNYYLLWIGYPMPSDQKSPAIDGGNPASPLDPDGTRADMGYIPYEQVYTPISGGEVNGTWYCSESPYYVFGDINIPVGQELIIEPCVHVMFQGDYIFEVFGRLLAEGDEYNQITFAATDTIECWQGLKIVNTNYNGQDSSKFVNCRITFSSADKPGPNNWRYGGAVYLRNSSEVLIKNCLINKNYAGGKGGAIYFEESLPLLINNIFRENSSPLGGAMYFAWSYPVIQGGIIENNEAESGGACFLNGSNPTFSGVTIRNNNAKFGGGIYMYGGCTPVFDPVNLCNIYMNYAYAAGLDFCAISWWGYPITINVDTFTVINSNSHFVYPEDIYTLNIQNGIIEQTNEDLYVSMTGSDENSGTNPSEPLKTMYMALMKIQADSTDPKTIHLDEGTFSQGATGELLPVNCREYVSLSGKGTDKSVIYGENKNQLLFVYDDSEFDIDSLKLNGGYAEEGGAIHLENYSSPILKELKITENTATGSGGGIFCSYNSSPTIKNSIIFDNFCEGSGGGISITTNCNPHINNITLNNNHALYQGGGLDARLYSNFSMDSSVVHNNTAANGGGMMIYFDSDPVITNTTISFNHGISEVSGYFGEAGGIWISYLSDACLTNVTIEYNEAGYQAGGIYGSSGSNSVFTNVIIHNNHAPKGGGIYLSGNANHRYYNCLIYQNSADEYSGGGIYMDQSDPIFINTTITDNTANSTWGGGALYARYSDPQLINCILWDNEPDEINGYNENVIAEYSDIMGSYPGIGNIDTDPIFTNPGIEDYRLQETSPCINAGNPDTTGLNLPLTDLDGNARISNDTIDMGAYEYQFYGAGIELELTVFLEGPFDGVDMNTDLNGLTILPLTQPYNTAPWNYGGTESVPSIPDVNIVDWVLIELRDAVDANSATSGTMIERQAAFLLNDGNVVGLDGFSNLQFNNSIIHQLFVVVWHRNHLGIMSANPLTESGGVYTYDFTTPEGQAYGTDAQKNLGGVYGMYAGDGDANDTIEVADKTNIWDLQAGKKGYYSGDFDMNGQVINQDKNDVWLGNIGTESQVPE